MMKRLDQRGIAAFEFCIVGAVFFTLVLAIFDLGRYAITMQSLRALANAGARQVMINCYTPAAIAQTTPACSGDPLPTDAAKMDRAPLSFVGALAPTLSTVTGGGLITVTASQTNFAMVLPIWGATFDQPSASTSIPY
jgi:TadE-like protein